MITNRNMATVLKKIRVAMHGKNPPVITMMAQTQRDPFRTLIATMLSLRTKDETTAPAAERLFNVADTPEKMVRLSAARIEKLIFPVGFYKTKAKSILKTCQLLIDEHKSIVPKDIDVLTTLPGVGRKTANLVLIEGYQIPAMCVDTHVHRISNRWGYIKTKHADESEQALRKKLPKQHWMSYNDLLVGFGQHICQPVSPHCSTCPLQKICPRLNVKKSR